MIDIGRFWWEVGQMYHAAQEAWITKERARAHRRFLARLRIT